jgi:hypothetical protein
MRWKGLEMSAAKRSLEGDTKAMMHPPPDYGIVERVLAVGDIAKLTTQERATYYLQTCESLGLNPLTQPFGYINLNGKLTLYAQKNATDQLRRIYGVSIDSLERGIVESLAVVTASASLPDGRRDTDVGSVSVKGLQGDALANAMMKAVTKAKRRVTLSIVGLGMLDESEISSIPGARRVEVTPQGEILGATTVDNDATAMEQSLARVFLERIDAATSKEVLVAIGQEMHEAHLPEIYARGLRRPWKLKLEALTEAKRIEPEPPDVNPMPDSYDQRERAALEGES